MYEGYLRLGDTVTGFEVANNLRVYDYASRAGVRWYKGCDTCDGLRTILYAADGYPSYRSVKDDPAPWFDEDNRDSTSFLGVAVMDVRSAEDSLVEANTTEKLTGGTVTGPPYRIGREMVVRLLLVATDGPGLQFGLERMRSIPESDPDPCLGQDLHFFSACPLICSHTELEADECLKECVVPYMHHFKDVRVVEGITVLTKRELPSGGMYAECEMVFQANDPQEYSDTVVVQSLVVVGGEPMEDPPAQAAPVDPWLGARFRPFPSQAISRSVPAQWYRSVLDLSVRENVTKVFGRLAPQIEVGSTHGSSGVRLVLMDDRTVVAGYYVPHIPAGESVRLSLADGHVLVSVGDRMVRRSGHVLDMAGGPPRWPVLPYGDYSLMVDQLVPGEVFVDVDMATVGAA